jgi:tetratricopeptide (TPR) repeat protein
VARCYGERVVETPGTPLWVGPYRLTARIATGGMAEVYVGRLVEASGPPGPMVAVKRLLPHLAKDSAIVRMFLNEARITAQIDHPNVVRIHELGHHEGEPYIAMELLEGRTFAQLRELAAEDGKRVPLPVALRILVEACRGLGAAHEAKDDDGQPLSLVHRDFTPDNIHVGLAGDVKVIDFGIAKTTPWSAGTEPGTLKGKYFYMSPEMIHARPVDRRADVFAAGVMLYEQMCGRRPFTGSSVDEVVMKIADGSLAPPSRFDPSLPKALEVLCLKALMQRPEARFQSMTELVAALEAVGDEARLASAGEVAAYVGRLFPPTDARRAALRRARELDPSVPGVTGPALAAPEPGAAVAPPLATPPRAEQAADVDAGPEERAQLEAAKAQARRALTLAAASAGAPGPASAPRPSVAPASAARKRALAAVAAGALLVGGLGAALLLRGGGLPAPERLARATRAASPEERARLLEGVARARDANDELLERAAALLVADAQWTAADSLADGWLEVSPRRVEPHLLKARASMRLRKGKRAEAEVAAARALSPDDPRPDAALAELRELQGDAAGALDAWTKVAAKTPGDAHALTRQGYWLSQAGRLDDAAAALTKALAGRFDAEAAAELGFVRFRQQRPDEALKLLARALEVRPGLMVAHYYRGAVLYQKGDVKAARATYLEADGLSGADPRPLLALCELEAHEGSPTGLDEARRRLRARFPAEAESLVKRCAP